MNQETIEIPEEDREKIIKELEALASAFGDLSRVLGRQRRKEEGSKLMKIAIGIWLTAGCSYLVLKDYKIIKQLYPFTIGIGMGMFGYGVWGFIATPKLSFFQKPSLPGSTS